ncbi:MAG: hypothetical protein U0T72_09040 [Chitinophagales bacterium]
MQEIGIAIAERFLDADVSKAAIEQIVCEALNFPIPLVNAWRRMFFRWSFSWSTPAFKDVGARLLALSFQYCQAAGIKILVATSGRTKEVHDCKYFLNVEGISVAILCIGQGKPAAEKRLPL